MLFLIIKHIPAIINIENPLSGYLFTLFLSIVSILILNPMPRKFNKR